MDSGHISKIGMGKLVSTIRCKIKQSMHWNIQAGGFINSKYLKVYFYVLHSSATNIFLWKFYVGDYNESRYDTILGRDIITALENYI